MLMWCLFSGVTEAVREESVVVIPFVGVVYVLGIIHVSVVIYVLGVL